MPIWQRLFTLTLISALFPVILAGFIFLFTSDATSFTSVVYGPVTSSVENQLKVSIDANGQRIDTRMGRIGSSILQLKALAEEVLGAPEFYGAFEPEAQGPGAPTGAADLDQAEKSLDNPLYYSVGTGGALRKLIDDGGSAVYYASHGGFTTLEMQRVYATAALDPLLIQPVTDDPLCLLSFIISSDNLLRIYPFRDTGSWPANLEFSKPYSYWSAAKANPDGLVWSAPYRSRFEDAWVVACLGAVDVGGATVAVVGCEVPVAALTDELLAFTLGTGGLCWLSMEQESADDGVACTVLAGQSGADEFLKLTPVAAANLPDDEKPTEELLAEADLYRRSSRHLAELMKETAPTGSSAFILDAASGQYLASVGIASVGWKLSGIIENPAIAAVEAFQAQANHALERNLTQLGLLSLASMLLAFLIAFVAGRRFSAKLATLNTMIRVQRRASPRPTGYLELDQLAETLAGLTPPEPTEPAPSQPDDGDSPSGNTADEGI